MIEKQINIHPKVQAGVFGRNDVNYKAIKTFFPKMKFVLRGDVLKFMGDESSVKHFAEVWDNIINYYENFNQLPLSTLNDILNNKYKIDSKELAGKEVLVYGNKGRVIKARTKNQLKMVTSIQKNDLLFAVGPAGSGKTYTAVALAVKALKERVVKKIILTRPAVEAGENLGFLPGDLKEKLDPYLQPLYDARRDMIPSEKLSEYLESGVIQIAP